MKIILGCVLPDPPPEPKTYYFYVYKQRRDGCGDWSSLALATSPEQAERDAQAALVGFPRKLCSITIT
jgi:hypothetical protein